MGYEPILDMTSTRMYNNGNWVNVNIHSLGDKGLTKQFSESMLIITPFKANLLKNKWLDNILSSKMKSTLRDYIENTN